MGSCIGRMAAKRERQYHLDGSLMQNGADMELGISLYGSAVMENYYVDYNMDYNGTT